MLLPCLSLLADQTAGNRRCHVSKTAVELLTHKAQTTTTNRPICLNYCPIFATVSVLCPLKCTDDDQRYPHITTGEIRHWISIMNTKVKCYSTVRISHVVRFSFRSRRLLFIPDFTTLFGKWLSQELPGSSKIQNVKNIFTARLRVSLVRHLPSFISDPVLWNSAPWAATSTLGVWANKAFFVLSCQAEKRDHLRLPGGALRLHIFICLTYLSSLADIHADSVQTSTRLENNRRWVEVSLNEGVYCW